MHVPAGCFLLMQMFKGAFSILRWVLWGPP